MVDHKYKDGHNRPSSVNQFDGPILPEEDDGYDQIEMHELLVHNPRVSSKALSLNDCIEKHDSNMQCFQQSSDTGSSYCFREVSGSHVTVNRNAELILAVNVSKSRTDRQFSGIGASYFITRQLTKKDKNNSQITRAPSVDSVRSCNTILNIEC